MNLFKKQKTMNSLLIVGAKSAGKSTTIDAICHALNPSNVKYLAPFNDIENARFENGNETTIMENGTYICEVDGKIILVSAGSPTEQDISISTLFEICKILDIQVDFAIVAMRSFEKKEGFDTRRELSSLGEKVFEKKIFRINQYEFRKTDEWKQRVVSFVKLIKENI